MPLDFYYAPGSPPCRAALLAAAAIGIDLNLKPLNLYIGEHLSPEFIKINPQHTIPTLDDNGFVVWESRAIMQYLQNQYGKDPSLYPTDPKERAVVDQRLYFDSDFYARFAGYYYPVALEGASFDPQKLEKLNEAFNFLDIFLTDSKYVASDSLTLADLSLVATISTCDAFGYDLSQHKNVLRWYDLVKDTAPEYDDANTKNLLVFKEKMLPLLNK